MFTKFLPVFILAIGAFVIPTFAGIVRPVNDNLADAITLNNQSGQSSPISNSTASDEPGEPKHAIYGAGQSIWYKYSAPGNGVLQVLTNLSDFDTTLAVYEGTSIANLKLVAQNDDIVAVGLSCTCSMVTFGTATGKTYYIAVDSTIHPHGNSSGNVVVKYTFSNSASNDNFANAFTLVNESGRMVSTTNAGASKESGEPNHAGNAGGKSVWFKWTAPAGPSKLYDFTINSVGVTNSTAAQTLFAMYTGSSVDNLTQVGRGEQYFHSKIVFRPVPATTYYIAVDGFDSGTGATQVTTTISYGVFKSDKVPDVDHDGVSDFAVFRPSTGTWYSSDSSSQALHAYQWGANGDVPFVSDYDYDGRPDFTVFRPDTGTWWISRSSIPTPQIVQWGSSGDIPMFHELHSAVTGINTRFPMVFRPSQGIWYVYNGAGSYAVQWGTAGDIPVSADFTGDAVDDITVFRPSNGTWYILGSSGQTRYVQFGLAGDKPVPADFDGDGTTDIAVYRPSTGYWYVLRSSDGQVMIYRLGLSTDIPQAMDYDGDGKADFIVFRPSIGRWYVSESANPATEVHIVYFGLANDLPIACPLN